MGTGKRGTRSLNKRSHWKVEEDTPDDDNEEFVDDLAFASTFAIIPSHGIGYPTTDPTVSSIGIPVMNAETNKKSDGDDNEIEVDDEESDDDDSENHSNKNKTDQIKEDSDSDSDSEEGDNDNEEHEDLVEALERMEPTNDDDDLATTLAVPPKTENEVDGYRVPIQELESKLQFQLTVDEEGSKKKLDPKQLSLAGNVKNFMVMDRTVVVESQKSTGGPLDEETILFIEIPINLSDGSNPETSSNDSRTKYIALGRIFEVFGPVSQPLYTIRLPSPPASENKMTKSEDNAPNQDEDNNQGDSWNQTSEKGVEISTNVEGIPAPTTEEIKISNASKTEQNVDRWAADGIYTKFLTHKNDIAVFYIKDEAKLIDTGLVLRSSGKGCDASNLYDEEVVNSNEIYYSDDEQERDAKSKKRGGSRRNQNQERNRQPQQHKHQQRRYPETTPMPAGFHVQSPIHPPPPPHHAQVYPSSNHFAQALPSGFHHHGAYSYPPPPPPATTSQTQGYYRQPQTYGYNYQFPSSASAPNPSSAPPPPPPPPPRNPKEPPAYQY
jgi:hypothetical protein